jgi:TolB-like protein/Tfp pilus assembly protein PilF
MSLYSELKRRNVFRVAAAYVVIGWLSLQVADVVLGFTGAPEWVGRTLIALLLLGFVPALALAWVFEMGPRGLQVDEGGEAPAKAAPDALASERGQRLDKITLVAVALVLGLMAWQQLRPRPDAAPVAAVAEGGEAAAPAPAPAADAFTAPPGSIAVLPFANRSAAPDTGYFADGVHDDLLTQLARNGGLKVISRTSVMEYRDTKKNLRQIGEELGVATILEGAVQRSGDRVRINAQLINAVSDEHLWADTFDRELTPENVFEIQTEIAAAIAGALGQTLVPGASAAAVKGEAPTRNAAAYDAYLKALAVDIEDRTQSALRRRAELYRQALAADPDFALAMGGLSQALLDAYWHGDREPALSEQAREWVERAVALQPDDPRLQLRMAEYLYRGRLDYEGALAWLDKAERGLPGSAEIMALRGFIFRRLGKMDQAIAAMERAVEYDPRASEVLVGLVEMTAQTGDMAAAQRWDDQMQALPDVPWSSLSAMASARLTFEGDTGPAERMLASMPSDTIDSARDAYWVPYLKRDYAQAARALALVPDELLGSQFTVHPKALLRARLAYAQGDAATVRTEATSAMAILDARIAANPADYRALVSRGFAQALLGNGEAARADAAAGLAQEGAVRDQLLRRALLGQQLDVLAVAGDTEELAAAMAEYLALDFRSASFDGMVLDPLYDRHRAHPAMRELEAKYSLKTKATP